MSAKHSSTVIDPFVFSPSAPSNPNQPTAPAPRLTHHLKKPATKRLIPAPIKKERRPPIPLKLTAPQQAERKAEPTPLSASASGSSSSSTAGRVRRKTKTALSSRSRRIRDFFEKLARAVSGIRHLDEDLLTREDVLAWCGEDPPLKAETGVGVVVKMEEEVVGDSATSECALGATLEGDAESEMGGGSGQSQKGDVIVGPGLDARPQLDDSVPTRDTFRPRLRDPTPSSPRRPAYPFVQESPLQDRLGTERHSDDSDFEDTDDPDILPDSCPLTYPEPPLEVIRAPTPVSSPSSDSSGRWSPGLASQRPLEQREQVAAASHPHLPPIPALPFPAQADEPPRLTRASLVNITSSTDPLAPAAHCMHLPGSPTSTILRIAAAEVDAIVAVETEDDVAVLELVRIAGTKEPWGWKQIAVLEKPAPPTPATAICFSSTKRTLLVLGSSLSGSSSTVLSVCDVGNLSVPLHVSRSDGLDGLEDDVAAIANDPCDLVVGGCGAVLVVRCSIAWG
ncbi:hypothetical protein BDK51DRAFT_41877 [Blyttiomyces helicus]|uniref:Uncharacterized protein n=1 Tax=Blyttiomyces helicus TaxID=388810 RepID=A0A4P9VZX6_9FUNG|nr:hypothetical protein BDK51DRAFT_41877 [Blyttiomyces helicus]|eukprot:RKO85401.1 hypothetical protein BDK51DRAFT_41877 [Blyttiomyces helicus]